MRRPGLCALLLLLRPAHDSCCCCRCCCYCYCDTVQHMTWPKRSESRCRM
jgi:hypothetical protein